MAPPTEGGDVAVAGGDQGQGQQQSQQQQGIGQTIVGIIRVAVFWYFISRFFFSSRKPPTSSEPAIQMSNIFQRGELVDMWLYLSEHEQFRDFGNEKSLVWQETNIPYAVWGPESTRSLSLKWYPSEELKHNGSLYAHVFFARSGYSPDPNDPEYDPLAAFGRTNPVVTYMPKSKFDKRRSLLGKPKETSDVETVSEEVENASELESKDDVPVEWISYWKPNITINLIDDFTRYSLNAVPPNIAPYLNIEPKTSNYFPTIYFNEFWLLRDKLIPVNETVTELPLNLEVAPMSMTKWQLFLQIDQSFQIHRSYGSMLEGESDELKRVFLEGNPYLLVVTMAVSLFHSLFDFLAFKNDIQFWNKNKSMEGLSAKSVVVNFVCQLVVFLYLLDNDTSWMILASSGVGCCIEFWKIGKALPLSCLLPAVVSPLKPLFPMVSLTAAAPAHLLPPLRTRRIKSSSSGGTQALPSPAAPAPICCNLSSNSHSQNPDPLQKLPPTSQGSLLSHTLPKKFSLYSTAASASAFLVFLSSGSAGGSGNWNNGGGGGGGGGSGNGGFWSRLLLSSVANAKEDESQTSDWDSHGLPANIVVQLNKLSGFKRYKLSEIVFFDLRRRANVGQDDSFFEMVSLRPGGIYTKTQLQKELETLATCGMFEKVDLEGKTNPDGTLKLTIGFAESTWQSADRFRCINVGLMQQSKPMEMDPDMTDKERLEYYLSQERDYKRRISRARPCLLPPPLHTEILTMLRNQGAVSARLLQRIRDRVQKWYHDEGYACAQVVNFGNLNTKEVVCEVVEGDVTELVIQFQDKLGNVVEGNTNLAVVRRELPKQLRVGHVFNIEAGKQALRNINSLGLFSNIEVNPRPDEKNEGGIIVEIKLKELDQKSAEVSTEWSIVPGRQGRPTLASIQPGGTVSFEHRNLKGLNRSILGSVTTSNFLNPQDDLAFKFEYVHPFLDGVYNPNNRTLKASCFNSRKLSPVFTGGPGVDEVPPIWVDRSGLKANITENLTRQSKFTYGLVMEEITTRDEGSHICAQGQRVLPSGGISSDGPETTLSGTGVDRMVFAQANITRDNTRFVNGAIVGERNVFQVDQGLGIGSKFPIFNRHQLTLTKFIQLKQVEEGAGKPPPPILVLHGHYGGCVGDLPSYDAFILGGPYSVRGYNMGELGAARNILEAAAELRIPIKGTHVYAFAEHGNDLGSSKEVKGNPTEVYRRVGSGSSYGVGVKLGLVRAEYAVDHNSGTGAVFFRFGERF